MARKMGDLMKTSGDIESELFPNEVVSSLKIYISYIDDSNK